MRDTAWLKHDMVFNTQALNSNEQKKKLPFILKLNFPIIFTILLWLQNKGTTYIISVINITDSNFILSTASLFGPCDTLGSYLV